MSEYKRYCKKDKDSFRRNMKPYERQCVEKLEDINKTLKELTKAVRDISFGTKLAREDLAEMKRILKEAKESDPENFINDYISKEDEQ